MSVKRKIFISVFLIVAITASVAISFNIVARDTYEFEWNDEYDGYEFIGFNGNSDITKVEINERLEKKRTADGVEWVPVEGDIITSVDDFTIISDEYIREIYISEHVRNIDETAFTYCKALEKIVVDDNNPYYKSVDGILFTADMKTLICFPCNHKTGGEDTTEYTVPDTVTRIARNGFYKCEKLLTVNLPEGLKEIGQMAFFKCWGLQRVELPDTVELIDVDAFSYCNSMKYAMFIPASVKEIGHHCFYKCDALEQFYVESAESDIILGGKWMPKSENAFAADAANFSAPRESYLEYVEKRTEEDYVPPVEDNGEDAPEETPQDDTTMGGMNKTAVILMIALIFVPGFAIVSVEVVRNVFKEDFLMTKRGKARLAKNKAEKEYIHNAYVNGEFADEEEADSSPDNTPENEEGEEEN